MYNKHFIFLLLFFILQNNNAKTSLHKLRYIRYNIRKKIKTKEPCIFPKLCATASNRLDLVYKYNILHIGSTFV